MTENSQYIQLNGILYKRDELYNLQIENEAKDSWQNAIFYFLRNWFDDSDFILAQTSGSTGKPKTIKLMKQSMINSAQMTNQFFELAADTTALLCLPAAYIAGKMMLVRAIVGGYNLLTIEPTANPFEKLSDPVDFAAITPYQLFHSVESLKNRSIRKIIVGGSPVTSKLEELTATIPTELYETYGMTETTSHIALRRFNGDEKTEYFSILKGITISHDERDCLVIEAPHLVENKIVTNDIVELINPSTFKWLGRADSVINSGGIKIYPEQVEKKLEKIIAASFFISSIPDELLENKVVLIIESEKFNTTQEASLKSDFKKMLRKYEFPKQIFYISNFEYSSNNKLLRNKTISKLIEQ